MIVHDLVSRYLPSGSRNNPSGWISFNCPMCTTRGERRPDSKRRGGLRFNEDESITYNCFNCGYKAGWSPGKNISKSLRELLLTFGTPKTEIQLVNLQLMDEKPLIKIEKKQISTPVWQESNYPPNTTSITESEVSVEYVAAVEYLAQREILDLADWHYSTYQHYKNRIILPFKYNNKLVGYTARLIPELSINNKKQPKYLNNMPKHFVFGLDAILPEYKYILVFEGPFDALCCKGVAVIGNHINEYQASILNKFKKQVVVVPDKDSSSMNLIKSAIGHGYTVSYPNWKPGIKDANSATQEYGRLFTVNSILSNIVSNPVKIEVQAKLWLKT
jgi:hypothetical protein